MTLAVGKQRMTGPRHRRLEPDRSQRILQRAALANVHVHVAGGDDRQTDHAGDGHQLLAARRVVGVEQALGRDPQRVGKAGREPACLLGIGHAGGQP